MFDTLTPAEREALGNKLADWGHAFAEIGKPLSFVALALDTSTDAGSALWDQRERYYAVMDELYDLRAEVLAA